MTMKQWPINDGIEINRRENDDDQRKGGNNSVININGVSKYSAEMMA